MDDARLKLEEELKYSQNDVISISQKRERLEDK